MKAHSKTLETDTPLLTVWGTIETPHTSRLAHGDRDGQDRADSLPPPLLRSSPPSGQGRRRRRLKGVLMVTTDACWARDAHMF